MQPFTCELVSHPEQMPRVLEIAMADRDFLSAAFSRRPPYLEMLVCSRPENRKPRIRFREQQNNRLSFPTKKIAFAGQRFLNDSEKFTILGGAGCAGAHAELIELSGKLQRSDRACTAREGVHRVRTQPV